MVDEQNKKKQPNLMRKRCVVGAKSSAEVKSCSFPLWPVNAFHVGSPDFSALSAERGIGLRRDVEEGGRMKIR